MLLGANNYCIEDFYVQSRDFYYLRSDNNTWYVTDSYTYASSIKPNYKYDSATQRCNPNLSYILGMEETDFNFLLGLMGVIFGGVFMFFTIGAFVSVGGKR